MTNKFDYEPIIYPNGFVKFSPIPSPMTAKSTLTASTSVISEIMNKADELKCEKPYNKMFINSNSIVFEFVRPGYLGQTREVIPRITDVKTYDNKVVKVLFADGTYEKAVLSENDTFSLEQGVSICLTKKLLSKIVGSDFSGSVYNKIVDYALGVYGDKVKAAKEAKEKAEKEKAAAKEKAEKIKAIRAKRKAQLREEQIEIQAEAYRRAMQKD